MSIPSRTPVPTSCSLSSQSYPQIPRSPTLLLQSHRPHTGKNPPQSCPTSCSWPGPGPALVDHRPFYRHLLAQIKDSLPPPSPLRLFPFLPLSLSPARRILVYIKVPFSVWCVKTICAAIQLLRVDQQPGIHFPSVNTSELSSTILLSPTNKTNITTVSQISVFYSHLIHSPAKRVCRCNYQRHNSPNWVFVLFTRPIICEPRLNNPSHLAVTRVCTPCATLVHHGRQRLPCVEHADRVW